MKTASDFPLYAAKFHSIFGLQLNKFLDSHYVSYGIVLDLFKFDDWLHKKHGEYENGNKSMKDIITEKYGEKAAKLIDELI